MNGPVQACALEQFGEHQQGRESLLVKFWVAFI
jgi:hypothetical protein